MKTVELDADADKYCGILWCPKDATRCVKRNGLTYYSCVNHVGDAKTRLKKMSGRDDYA